MLWFGELEQVELQNCQNSRKICRRDNTRCHCHVKCVSEVPCDTCCVGIGQGTDANLRINSLLHCDVHNFSYQFYNSTIIRTSQTPDYAPRQLLRCPFTLHLSCRRQTNASSSTVANLVWVLGLLQIWLFQIRPEPDLARFSNSRPAGTGARARFGWNLFSCQRTIRQW